MRVCSKAGYLIRLCFSWALVVLVTSCAGDTQPFSKRNAPSGKTPPPITLTAMNGIPDDKAKLLFDNLSVAAGKRDIAIVRGEFSGGYYMVGEFEALPTASDTQLTYRWTIYDGKKQVIHKIANTDTGRIGGADPWTGVDADLLRRVAGFTSESLATRLHALGYATRLSGLPPPGSLAKAGPNAAKDIDYETIYGPGNFGPGVVAPGVVAPTQLASAPVLPSPPSRLNVGSVKKKKVQSKSKSAKKKISAVAMTKVTGSPGRGNRDLLIAMRKVMKSAGWPVLTRPRHDALTVSGKVKLDRPRGSKQKVAVSWTVKTPDGKVLGTIRQANNVPAGSLDKGWGKSATYVSQAAAQGIFKLVNSTQ